MQIKFSADENIVCIAENDACGIDAIQVLLGCSVGKGNLLFHVCGKQAFNFYDRQTGKSVRLVLRPLPQGLQHGDSFQYYQSHTPADLFEIKDTRIPLPEQARNFHSYFCDECGEKTGENWIRIQGDKKLCTDCYQHYDRFRV